MLRVLTIVLFPILAFGQFEKNYTPKKVYTKNSEELISKLREQTIVELKGIKTSNENTVEKIYKTRFTLLIKLIGQKAIIQDDTIEYFLQRILDRINQNNNLKYQPGRILIIKEPSANAICYGEGTFLITIGLLSKITSESQLAFTIAHEIAHYELEHVKKQILKSAEREVSTELKTEFDKLTLEDITPEAIERIKKYMYSIGHFNRSKELSADSLGFVYFKNSGYKEEEAFSLLSKLDSATFPKYYLGAELFKSLEFSQYPFQVRWLNERLSIYSKERITTFIIPFDSMRTHPEFEVRKALIKSYIHKSEKNDVPISLSNPNIKSIALMADFEMVEAAYINNEYDKCLYFALQLKAHYPNNTFLNIMIGRVLTKISEVRLEGARGNYYISHSLRDFNEELKLVNNFLYNIKGTELSELTYHFLSNEENFDEDSEECYYLLWKICDLTYRNNKKNEIKQSYKRKFPDGKLDLRMR